MYDYENLQNTTNYFLHMIRQIKHLYSVLLEILTEFVSDNPNVTCGQCVTVEIKQLNVI